MYKVFINDKPLFLVHPQHLQALSHCAVIEQYQSLNLLQEAILSLEYNDNIFSLVVWHENIEELWQRFLSLFTVIEAAGGLVENSKVEYLFIFRLNKWDLPKGKIEKKESIKDAAVREVEEECGVHGLQIKEELPKTYHTYRQKGKDILKVTHWFRMDYRGKEEPVPQHEEGISEVSWIPGTKLGGVYDNTFSSIRDVLEGVAAQND